jgi:hypothetical protein
VDEYMQSKQYKLNFKAGLNRSVPCDFALHLPQIERQQQHAPLAHDLSGHEQRIRFRINSIIQVAAPREIPT